jgi:hypothetical protein
MTRRDDRQTASGLLATLAVPLAALFGILWLILLAETVRTTLLFLEGPAPVAGEPTDAAEIARNTAQTLALRLAALAGLLAPAVIGLRMWIAWRQTQASERQAETAESGHITERMRAAIEQLGAERTVKRDGAEFTAPNIEVRPGAIYALERIAQDSERDHIPIMETLCAYIRENANPEPPRESPPGPLPERGEDPDPDSRPARIREWRENLREVFGPARPLRADVQTAFAVIARRRDWQKEIEREREFRLDLGRANLQGLDLARADLRGGDLSEARLEGADLRFARLEGANLRFARLEGADLVRARLEGADLDEARLEGADLHFARLEGADLHFARLEGADLHFARLEGANLRGAGLEGADLDGARLNSADLRGWSCARARLRSVDLTEAKNLDPESVRSAFGVRAGIGLTLLPEGGARSRALARRRGDRRGRPEALGSIRGGPRGLARGGLSHRRGLARPRALRHKAAG